MNTCVCGVHFRAQLTALHHNENCNRDAKLKKDGTPVISINRCKGSLNPSAYVNREEATYSK